MTTSKRFLVTIPAHAEQALADLMHEDMQTNRSSFISKLIADEAKRRKETANKRPQGRPKKEPEAEEQPIYDHPDQYMNKGRKVTKTDLLNFYLLKQEPVPQETLDLIEANENK